MIDKFRKVFQRRLSRFNVVEENGVLKIEGHTLFDPSKGPGKNIDSVAMLLDMKRNDVVTVFVEQELGEFKKVRFKWDIEPGTGYNRCQAIVDGVKGEACSGGNYDMFGTALGNWIEEHMAAEVVEKYAKERNNSLGLSFHRGKPSLDGGVGEQAMQRILRDLGWETFWISENHRVLARI